MNDYARLKKQGYVDTEVNPDLSDVSKVNLSTEPMAVGREDKSVNVTNQEGVTKKTSSIMMGYNKAGVVLPDGEYINLDELEAAIDRELASDSENVISVVKKTGKKIDTSNLKEEIRKKLKEKAEVLLNGQSEKITNQETSKISIKGENSSEVYNKGVLMFGNENINMSNGEYVERAEFEKAFSEYKFLKPGEVIEVEEVKNGKDILKKFKKPLLISGGLTALSLALLPILAPGVMHANSVLWHTDLAKNIPIFQDFLHACNIALGKIVGATYTGGPGIWNASNGSLINGDAAQASVIAALAVHTINTTSISATAAKIIAEIKNLKKEKREKKLEELNNLKAELNPNNVNVQEGGLSL